MELPGRATAAEREMAEALARGDGPEYARLLRSVPLLIPTPPPPGAAAAALLRDLFPPDATYVPVFTSLASLAWVFGEQARYEETDLETLLRRWPGDEHRLAVNPGTPIAAYLPPDALAGLAAGTRSLVSTDDMRRAVADELLNQVREACLAELAGRPAQPEPAGGLRDDQPANRLESALHAAVSQADGEAYVHALLAGDPVLLPITAPVADPDRIVHEDLPWRVLGGEQARVIPVFTSPAMLERSGAGDVPRIEVEMIDILLSWPDEEHLLYVNPGSRLELALQGDLVLEIVGAMADSLEDADAPD